MKTADNYEQVGDRAALVCLAKQYRGLSEMREIFLTGKSTNGLMWQNGVIEAGEDPGNNRSTTNDRSMDMGQFLLIMQYK